MTDFTQVKKRLAIVEITKLGASDSWAEIRERFDHQKIEQGSQAVLVDLGSISLIKKIVLKEQDNDIVPSWFNQKEAFEKIKLAIPNFGKGFIVLAEDNDDKQKIDYQVGVNSKGEFEIWDSAGVIIQNLNPALKISESTGAVRTVQRLVHLAKYNNVQQLDNHDSQSPLTRKLSVELFELQPDYEPGDKPELQQLLPSEGSKGNANSFKEGQYLALRISNNSSQVLNVTALDLQPDWGIAQVYPSSSDTYFMPMDPGKFEIIPLKTGLPQGYMEGRDVIKVFATVGPTNFRWLELPSLDQPTISRAGTENLMITDNNPLEELMAKMADDIPKTRNVDTVSSASYEWTASQIEIEIKQT